jgi:hypothetical protein
MQQPTAIQYPISDILEWAVSKKLVLTPKFQRRSVWIPKAKAFLIDTILRGMPIPPIFIRQRIDPIKQRAVREVIDGQQRLKAVLDFIGGEFSIMEIHNEEYGGYYYNDLPEAVRTSVLGYKFTVNVFDDISDNDVLNIFARINTYTVKLNAQELRNAQYFGLFRQTIYKLAHKHYAFWTKNKILSESQIARMGDAEFTSELVISIMDGIQQTKDSDINRYYREYDDVFERKSEIEKRFSDIIGLIADMLEGELSNLEFKRIPVFYSLFVVLYDAKYGLPNSDQPRLRFTANEIRRIAGKIKEFNIPISSQEIPAEYQLFVEYTKLSTADVGKRRYRHNFLWDKVLSELG